MERLRSLDAVFLSIEHATSPMNIGSLALFEGPPPPFEMVAASVEARLALVPRCRQRVRESRHGFLRPVWEEAPDFDLRRHLHHLAMEPHDTMTLEELMEQVMVQALDRHRPLWEMFVVDGLDDGRWAVVSKMHHCMVDGVAGTDLLSVMLDRSPGAGSADGLDGSSDGSSDGTWWTPEPEPLPFERWRFRILATAASTWTHLVAFVRALARPRRTWRRVSEFRTGARAMWRQPARGASPLTGPIGGHRRWLHTRLELTDVARVRAALGGSVNDAVLTSIALGFRDLMLARGLPVDGHDVMTLMPVSMRRSDEHGVWDNRVAVTHALLPVGSDDPVVTHAALRRHLDQVKVSHMTDASSVLLHSGDHLPHAMAVGVARFVVRAQRNLETITTNVPGPQFPLHMCGRRMEEMYPFAPIAGRIRIAVAVWSYCGTLYVGVTADRDSVTDLAALVHGIDHGFERLVRAAT